MKIIRWSSEDIAGLEALNLAYVLTEVNDNGYVVRELGVSREGVVAYTWPGGYRSAARLWGLFDNQRVEVPAGSPTGEVAMADFEQLWAGGKPWQ